MKDKPLCNYNGCKPYPAVGPPETLISTGETWRVCRRHRSHINYANAQHVGRCEWNKTIPGMRSPRCTLPPLTMMKVEAPDLDNEKIAVCRKHRSAANEVRASQRIAR